MVLIDTHCHIHAGDYPLDPGVVIENARKMGVNELICVGTSLDDSQRAVEFCQDRLGVWASIGIHPHDAKQYINRTTDLQLFSSLANRPKVVAIGECGL